MSPRIAVLGTSGFTGKECLRLLGAHPEFDVAAALSALPAGHGFTVPEVLFAKITDEQREEWQMRFSGTRS